MVFTTVPVVFALEKSFEETQMLPVKIFPPCGDDLIPAARPDHPNASRPPGRLTMQEGGSAGPQKVFPLELFFAGLLKAAQLAAVDLDTVGIAVFGDIALVNLVLSGDGERLRAGDPLLNPFCAESLCNLF